MMRIFAIHDALGNISQVVTAPTTDSAKPVIMTPAGLTMTEIGDLPVEAESLESRESLAEFVANYVVSVEDVGVARVVTRGPESSNSS